MTGSLCIRQGLATNQTRGQPCLLDHLHLVIPITRGTHTIWGSPGAYSSGTQGMGCTGQLLQKAISLRSRNNQPARYMEVETANRTKWDYRGACSNQKDKTPEEKLSEVEIGELPDRVQGSDHKDERTPEKNGWTQWEIWQRVRRYKDKSNRWT